MTTIEAFDRELQAMNLTNPKVIILWKDEDVLLRAIELLLNTKVGWKVTRFADHWDENSLLQIVDEIHPDVFIVHEGVLTEKMHLFTKFVLEFSKLKIITLSLENNLVNIYNRSTLSIREVTDLFSIIEDNIPMNERGGETRTFAGVEITPASE